MACKTCGQRFHVKGLQNMAPHAVHVKKPRIGGTHPIHQHKPFSRSAFPAVGAGAIPAAGAPTANPMTSPVDPSTGHQTGVIQGGPSQDGSGPLPDSPAIGPGGTTTT